MRTPQNNLHVLASNMGSDPSPPLLSAAVEHCIAAGETGTGRVLCGAGVELLHCALELTRVLPWLQQQQLHRRCTHRGGPSAVAACGPEAMTTASAAHAETEGRVTVRDVIRWQRMEASMASAVAHQRPKPNHSNETATTTTSDSNDSRWGAACTMLDHCRAAAFKDCSVLVSLFASGSAAPQHHGDRHSGGDGGTQERKHCHVIPNTGGVCVKMAVVDLDFKG